jgi:hypothetical protein
VGLLEKGANNKLWLSRVILRPLVRFAAGTMVDDNLLADIHHQSHAECFVANSVMTAVTVVPRL